MANLWQWAQFFFFFSSLSCHQQRHTQWRVPLLLCLPQPPQTLPTTTTTPSTSPFSPVHSMQFNNMAEEPRLEREKPDKRRLHRQIPFPLWFCVMACATVEECNLRQELSCYLFFCHAWGNWVFTERRAARAMMNFRRRGTYFNQVISFFNFNLFCHLLQTWVELLNW